MGDSNYKLITLDVITIQGLMLQSVVVTLRSYDRDVGSSGGLCNVHICVCNYKLITPYIITVRHVML